MNTKAESDVEDEPPKPSMTSELDVDALPRESPTLGSLFGFCRQSVNRVSLRMMPIRTRGSIRLTMKFNKGESTMVGIWNDAHGHLLDRMSYRT